MIDRQYIYNYFLDNECELLEDYNNARTLMNYRCSCGNIAKITWDNFKNGHRCASCCGGGRLTHEYVASVFRDHGCVLLDIYNNSKSRMKYLCSCGNESTITYNNFILGKRCAICGNNNKPTQHDVEEYFHKQGCKLIGVYINANTPVDYICQCGNTSKIRLAVFKKGQRCRCCFAERNSGANNYNWNSDRESINTLRLIRKKCHRALETTLNLIGVKKFDKSNNILGYTANDLKFHLESYPNWNELKKTDWQLDHIFPIKAFCEYKIFDIKLINCLENLQPLTKHDNCRKNDYYSKTEFEKWLVDRDVLF